jgi:hypothetical protein
MKIGDTVKIVNPCSNFVDRIGTLVKVDIKRRFSYFVCFDPNSPLFNAIPFSEKELEVCILNSSHPLPPQS